MAGRDRIGELPADILDKILGFLPIVQAARMVVLSTIWRDIWFSLTELNFDDHFFCHIKKKYSHAHSDSWISAGLYVIRKVLIQHNGLIRKFVFRTLYPSRNTVKSRSFDFDQWLLFVTRKGVEEIYLELMPEDEYRLPNCIFSCLTLRRLHLWGVVETINSHCTLPNVTSLCFENVNFDGGNLSVDVPMLNNLSFFGCDNVTGFNISAQKLDRLAIDYCHSYQLLVNLDLRFVRSLELDSLSLKDFINGFTRRGLQLQPPALNVEYLMLSCNDEYMAGDLSSAFIHLLRICPGLCKLDIDLLFSGVLPKLPELLHSVGQRHKMLHALKLNPYLGGEDETLFIKALLACFPSHEKVDIFHEPICDCDEAFEKNKEELLHFPSASKKVEIIFNINSYGVVQ